MKTQIPLPTAGQFPAMDPQAFFDNLKTSMSSLTDVAGEGKKTVEALTTSLTAAAKGAEALGAETMAYTKAAFEGGVAHAQALGAAKSPQDVIELQTAYAKTWLNGYVAQMSRGFDLVSSTVKASTAPLSERAAAMTASFQAAR